MSRRFMRLACGVIAAAAVLAGLGAVSAFADYPQPVQGDTYTRERVITAAPVPSMEMAADGFAFDANGNMWVCEWNWTGSDPYGGRLVKYNAAGMYLGSFGSAELNLPTSVAFSPYDNLLYVTDAGNHCITIVDPATGLVLGSFGALPSVNPPAAPTDEMDAFDYPTDIAFAPNGDFYVTDYLLNRVVKFNAAHTPLTAWGSGYASSEVGGFNGPAGLTLDASGTVWVADSLNDRVQHFDGDGAPVSVLSPSTQPENLQTPQDVYVDGYGTIYVVDLKNATPWQNGRIARYGSQFDFLGEYGSYGSNPVKTIYVPTKVQVDADGGIWISDKIGEGVDGAIERWALNAGEPDLVPPVTTSTVDSHFWYKTPVDVVLTATDASSPVVATYYSTDGSEPTSSYASPFTVSTEGTTTLKYFSVDRPGNAESVVTQHIQLDLTEPHSWSSIETTYYGSGQITFGSSDNLSGVRNVWWRMNNGLPSNDPVINLSIPGHYTLEYWAEDIADNREASHFAFFTVTAPDSTPPITIWPGYRPDWFNIQSGAPVISFAASDTISGVDATYYTLDGGPTQTWNGIPYDYTVEGTHTLTYWSVDRLSHVETPNVDAIRIDMTEPDSWVSQYTPGQIGSGTVTFAASDAVSGVQTVQWKIPGVPGYDQWMNGYVGTIPSHGNYTVEYRAVDKAGNVEAPHTLTVQILQPDSNPPTTTANIPDVGWVRAPRNVIFTAYDDVSGIEGTYYSIDSSPWARYNGDLVVTQEGEHSVAWYSVDQRGNKEETRTATLRCDGTDPWTTTDALPYYQGATTIHFTGHDALSSATTWYRVDGQTYASNQLALNDYRLYDIEYWSVDAAGNEETHNFISVAVNPPDNTPPVTTYSGPAGWQKGYGQFTLSAYDASSSVRFTYYSTDGTNFFNYPDMPVTVSQDGTTTISYYSVDFYNNREATKTAQMSVDGSAPYTGSNITTTFVGEAPIELYPSDPYSGVAATKYRLDGGAWTTGTALTVPWSRSWSGKNHTLEWYSTDKVGNKETTRSAQFMVRMSWQKYEQTDSRVVYREPQNWNLYPTSSTKRSTVASDFALIQFTGTGAELYSLFDPTMGPMRVTLSGMGLQESSVVDLNLGWQSWDFAWGRYDLEYGDYLIKIEPAGTGRINLDYVRVEGALQNVADVDPPVVSSNAPAGWVVGTVSASLSAIDTTTGVKAIYGTSNGATPTVTNTYTAPFSINTEGSTLLRFFAVDWRGNASAESTALVRIDNTAPLTNSTAQSSYLTTASIALLPNDPYSGVTTTKWRLDGGSWIAGTSISVPSTALGPHSLEWYSVDALGHTEQTKTASFIIAKRYEQTDSAIRYQGPWTLVAGGAYSGGSYMFASAPATAHVMFTGTAFDLTARKGPGFGIAAVSIDGAAPVMVDLYSASNSYKVKAYSITGLSNSTHTVTIAWTGQQNAAASGNLVDIDTFDATGPLVADTTPPSTTCDAPSAWRSTPVTVTLTATDSHTWVAATRYTVNGGTATTYTRPFAISAEGTSVILYASTDGANNTETTASATVRIDRTAPIVTADAPVNWTGSPALVTLSASDAGVGGAQILYSIDGSEPSIPYTGAISVSAQGATTVRYKAHDSLGNMSSVASVSVLIDDQAPSTSDDAPTGWSATPVDLTLSATDTVSGVASIGYKIDGGDEMLYSAPIHIDNEGTAVVQYRATDVKGNVSEWKTATVRVDLTKPFTGYVAPSVWTGSPVLVTLEPSDAVSSVQMTYYSTDGTEPTIPYTGPFAVTAQGATEVRFYSVDAAGNAEDVSSRTVLIDDQAPSTSDDAPTGWVIGPVGVKLTANDPVSGVALTRYTLNNGVESAYGDTPILVSDEGTTTLRYASIDVKGNIESTKTAVIRVDNTKPSTTSNAVAQYSNAATITLTPSDTLSGVSGTEWRIDGGAWNAGTVITTAVPGQHVVEWRTHDVAGNVENTKSATISILKRYEQGESAFRYQGAWTPVNGGAYSGGSYTFASAPATAHITFTGTSLELIARKGPTFGIAAVSIDGAAPTMVDLYSASNAYKTKVFSSGALANTTHKVTISWTGTSNAAATGNLIDIDSLDLIGIPVADVVAPTSSATWPEGWVKGPATVAIQASDAETFVQRIAYSIDSGVETTYTTPIQIATEGTHTVTFRAIDGAGNAEAPKSATVYVDSSTPHTADDAPTAWTKGPVTLTLTATDAFSGVASTDFSLDGGDPTTSYTAPIVISEQGTTTVAFRSTDAVGNIEGTKTRTVRIDDGAPMTTVDAPTGWAKGPVTLHFDATDSLSGVAVTHVSVNGAEPIEVGPAGIELADGGLHTVEFASTDGAGNVEATQLVTVYVDTYAPIVDVYAPTEWVDTATVTLEAHDSHSGVAAIYASIDGEPAVECVDPIVFDTDGDHTVAYHALDAVGNRSDTQTVTVHVDATAPSSQADHLSGWQPAPVTVTLTAADPYSGVASTHYRIDGGADSVYTEPFTISAEGTTTVEFWSVDALGHVESPKTTQVLVDRVAPVTSNDRVPTYTGEATVTLLPSDAGSGVDRTMYRVNGGELTTGTVVRATQAGDYSVEYFSVDAVGNVEASRSTTFTVKPLIQYYEQDATPLAYSTGWAGYSSAAHSGGSHAWTGTYGASVNVRFNGTALTWKGLKSTTSGIAQVVVDGGTPVTVDLYSAVNKYKQVIWSVSGLPEGQHDISISYTGTKNAASAGTLLSVDAFEVNGALVQAPTPEVPPQVFEETNSKISFGGTWTSYSGVAHSGGSYKFTNSTGGASVVSFTGTSLDWFTMKSPTAGIARVTVDTQTPVLVDLYAPSALYKQRVWGISGLADKRHDIKIEWTGAKNSASTGTFVGFDYVMLRGNLEQGPTLSPPSKIVEQNSSHISYESTWTTYNSGGHSGGSYIFTNSPGGRATVAFSGTSLDWRTLKSPSSGIARVTVDTQTPVLVDLYASSNQYKQRVFSVSGLSDSPHVVTIEWTGTKHPASSGTFVGIDSLELTLSLAAKRFEQTHSFISYESTWTNYNSGGHSGGSYIFTNGPGGKATINFTGTSFDWLTLKSATGGIARVTLDGGTPVNVDLYAPSAKYKSVVWSVSGLTDGKHTVTIEWTGTKNAASTGTYVGIDAIDVWNSLLPK